MSVISIGVCGPNVRESFCYCVVRFMKIDFSLCTNKNRRYLDFPLMAFVFFFLHISFYKKYCYHRSMLTSVNLISFHFHSNSLKRKETKEDDIEICDNSRRYLNVVTRSAVLYSNL